MYLGFVGANLKPLQIVILIPRPLVIFRPIQIRVQFKSCHLQKVIRFNQDDRADVQKLFADIADSAVPNAQKFFALFVQVNVFDLFFRRRNAPPATSRRGT